MKITTTAGQLSDLLGRVARAAAARPTIPLLQGVLFRAHEGEGGSPGSLAMAATATEISLTLNASAPVEEAGAAVVPAKVLLRYARSLSKGADLTLQASETERTATLASGKSSVTLRCFPAEDFPAPALFPQEGAFAVPTEALTSSVARVLPFASGDESRPVLTGVLVEFEETSARLVATDSYRLGVDEADLRGAKRIRATRAILPARALKEAARLASLGTETMYVSLTENACAFSVGGGALAPRAGGRSLQLQGATARLLALGAIPEPPAASTALAAAVVAAFDHPAGAATSKKTNVLTLPPRETARRLPLPTFPF